VHISHVAAPRFQFESCFRLSFQRTTMLLELGSLTWILPIPSCSCFRSFLQGRCLLFQDSTFDACSCALHMLCYERTASCCSSDEVNASRRPRPNLTPLLLACLTSCSTVMDMVKDACRINAQGEQASTVQPSRLLSSSIMVVSGHTIVQHQNDCRSLVLCSNHRVTYITLTPCAGFTQG
jgi:hypothetical protein